MVELDLLALEGLGALVDLVGHGTFPDALELDGRVIGLVGLAVEEALRLVVLVGLEVGLSRSLDWLEAGRLNIVLDGLVVDQTVGLDVEETVDLELLVGLVFEELGQLAVLAEALMGRSAEWKAVGLGCEMVGSEFV